MTKNGYFDASESPIHRIGQVKPEMLGPYSAWPRKKKMHVKELVVGSATAVLASVFVHCVLPIIA